MKSILLRRLPGEPILSMPALDIIVDSAIVMPGRPLFMPDDLAPAWKGRLYPAYRVSRLGKAVSPKFASRYYDSVTLALRLVPQGWPQEGALAGLFDNALALGQWVPVGDGQLSIDWAGETITLSPSEIQADEAVATVSNFATIKQGDVIMPCALPVEIELHLADNISASLNGEPCLNVRIR